MPATQNPFSMFDPTPMAEYLVDTAQRSVLFWDVQNQRGNQYLEHMARTAPHVLTFEHELIMDGRTLAEPVNYGLVKIVPPEGIKIDQGRRPFVVIDPRAGHGPGIGGFKADSEIGMALKEGHPCYFVGFLPQPEPGQTIEKIMRAEALFLERVIELHPLAEEKPVLIGNCQAGWAVMLLAATRPELCGPIIVAGSPLSYWAGERGKNPMRYSGGLLGGSWLTALASDLGNGKFDGANLVQNMESLNPANTLWDKQYSLYSKIDTEGPRYLGFERWWGGHVILNGEEMQYMVDNLFVGNRLSSAEITTGDGIPVDFRKIRSPILCFCSKGDNITPPQQALGWIPDLYGSVDDIRAAGQTIVYAVHDRIGHLGIFVSGGVAKKEHQEFTQNIDFIDCLPPGLYEAVIEDVTDDTVHPELVGAGYISRFAPRTLGDIREMGGNGLDEERCFATVSRLSDLALDLYRSTAQPLVRSIVTEESAEMLRRMHPLRLGYEMFSDGNPAMTPVKAAAEMVRENRWPMDPDNIYLQWEKLFATGITNSLNIFRDFRDMMVEHTFFGIYDQPWLQTLLGLPATDDPPRPRPDQDPDHKAFVKSRIAELLGALEQGGLREAGIRGLLHVRMAEGASDERGFEMLQRIRKERGSDISLAQFKQIVREQFFMLLLDEKGAVAAIPALLKGHEKEAPQWLEYIQKVATAPGPLGKTGQKRMASMAKLFAPKKPKSPNTKSSKTS
jgi:pimeloyl-ACP methyl ester carboxylesterase